MKKQGPGAMAIGAFVLLTRATFMFILASPHDINAEHTCGPVIMCQNT